MARAVAKAMAKLDGSLLTEREMSLVGVFFGEEAPGTLVDHQRETLKKELVALQKAPLIKKLEGWGLPKPPNEGTTTKVAIVDQLLEHLKILGKQSKSMK